MTEQINQLHIAGPCALQSLEQGMISAKDALANGVSAVRLSLYKPRTRPGAFEGLKEAGIPILREITQATGIIPATEVLTEKQAHAVADEIVGRHGRQLILWLGARNYNQEVQQGVGSIAKNEPRIQIGVKNPMQPDEEAWMGGIEWVLAGGASTEQVFSVHRGFYKGFVPNPHNLRNPYNFEIAMNIRQRTGLPVVIDPSHIGGSVENVFRVIKDVEKAYTQGVIFDGSMIEVHPDGIAAKTDANQQLNWSQYAHIRQHSKIVFTSIQAA